MKILRRLLEIMHHIVLAPFQRARAIAAIQTLIADQRPDVMHRTHFRAVHTGSDCCWVESTYCEPENTIPPLARLFTVNHQSGVITEHPIEDIIQFEWWQKAPLDYAREQRSKLQE